MGAGLIGDPTRGVAGVATCANAADPKAEAIAAADAAASKDFMILDS